MYGQKTCRKYHQVRYAMVVGTYDLDFHLLLTQKKTAVARRQIAS